MTFNDFTEKYCDNKLVSTLLHKFKTIDIDKAMEEVFLNKTIIIPHEVEDYYRRYFKKRFLNVDILIKKIEEKNSER